MGDLPIMFKNFLSVNEHHFDFFLLRLEEVEIKTHLGTFLFDKYCFKLKVNKL